MCFLFRAIIIYSQTVLSPVKISEIVNSSGTIGFALSEKLSISRLIIQILLLERYRGDIDVTGANR